MTSYSTLLGATSSTTCACYSLPVLVEHDGKVCHGTKGLVSEGEVKENGPPTLSPVARDLQTFPLDIIQEYLMMGHNMMDVQGIRLSWVGVQSGLQQAK